MAYDFVRWGAAIVIFAVLVFILIKKTKDKGKSILIASFAAIISFAILLLVPVENYFFGFKSVEQIYNYRYHENMITYAECDEGVVCVIQKDASIEYRTFGKKDGKYKLPMINDDSKIAQRSSRYGMYLIRIFDNQVLIMTPAKNSCYDGVAFKECKDGYYYYTVIENRFNYSLLTCEGEKVQLT